MSTSVIVLGAGMVGSVMARDLADEAGFDVTIADKRPDALARAAKLAGGKIETVEVDLGDPDTVKRAIEPFDHVCGALASGIGFQTLRAVIEAGKNYSDISFMPEDAIDLDDLAKQHGVTAVVDCGVAPGVSNMLAGYGHAQLDECERIDIYVGGVPRDPKPPYLYKAAFSPSDVIEEYTRPSRLVEHGKTVIKDALTEPEMLEFPGVGTLEAFNTDGLRSLAVTLDVPFMREKTMRYVGHRALMEQFRDAGLFGLEPIEVGGAKVCPREFLSALMFPDWTYAPGEEDMTVMRVIVEGTEGGQPKRYQWDLIDTYDRQSQCTSMARTTAFPCAIVARMILAGKYQGSGVINPELIGAQPGLLDHVMDELKARGVQYEETR